jgi:DNA-binding transcriptional MerR regulator
MPEISDVKKVANAARCLLKAGELGRQTGLTRQSLHQYVLLGLLQPVDMTKGGQRLFEPDAVDRVKLIRDLVACGYTLRDIRDTFFKQRPDGK